MKKIGLSIWFAAYLVVAFSQGISDARQHRIVLDFMGAFKPVSKEKIAARTLFPLNRQYPLPPVTTKGDFLKRFNDIFDETLLSKIAGSKPSVDWSAMGEKGYMLGDGEVWLDSEGKLIAVNYQSAAEKQRRDALVEADKKGLHASIRAFLNPVCVLETAKFRVRIDELAEGGYRYASWRITSAVSDKPELVLKNGTFEPDGSGGQPPLRIPKRRVSLCLLDYPVGRKRQSTSLFDRLQRGAGDPIATCRAVALTLGYG